MKTKSTVLTIAALVVSALTLAANPLSKIAVINEQKSGTFKVIYQGSAAGKVTLKVYNSSSEQVFSETINGMNGFIRPLNFEGMESGTYTIEITDSTGKQIQKVDYNSNEAAKETTISAFHVSKLEAGKYLVSIANKGTENVNIRIFDSNSNLVHDESRTIVGDLGVVYNLKEVVGQPVFVITDNTGKNHTIK